LGAYMLLAASLSALNPVFEAPDENHHFWTAHHIAEHGTLPVAAEGTGYRQEAAQPPLYYLLAVPLIKATGSITAGLPTWHNSYVRLGKRDAVVNRNALIHTEAEAWPWHDGSLAVHMIRLLSVALGLGSLLCIYKTGRRLWPTEQRQAWLAVGLVAALPQWGFVHSTVSNDALIICLASFALYQSVDIWLGTATPGRWIALGATVGCAVLAKLVGLLLLLYVLLLITMLAWRDHQWGSALRNAGLCSAPVLLLTGWWFWRNWLLYRDPTATSVFIELAGGERQLALSQFLAHLDGLWLSSIGLFGWMNVKAAGWVYWIWKGIGVVCAAGWLMAQVPALTWRRSGKPRPIVPAQRWGYAASTLFLPLWPVMVFGSWFQFNLRTPAEQGRLLFPAILPVALLLGYGLNQWRWSWLQGLTILAAFGTTIWSVAYTIPQSYATPELIQVSEIPADAAHIGQDMGQGVELVASRVRPQTAHPGDSVTLDAYWRVPQPVATPALVSPAVLGRDYIEVAALPDAYHGAGAYPSVLWPPNQIVHEVIRLELSETMTTPTLGRVYLRLDGQEPFVEVGRVKVTPRQWPRPDQPILAQVEGGIALTNVQVSTTSASPGDTVTVRVRWQVIQAVGRQLTTFVHVALPGQPPLAQADGPALGGHYPSQYWAAGEVFDDAYQLTLPPDLPAGQYPVWVGLYDPVTGIRLPLHVGTVRAADDALKAGELTVK
jgi:hypothetical protein